MAALTATAWGVGLLVAAAMVDPPIAMSAMVPPTGKVVVAAVAVARSTLAIEPLKMPAYAVVFPTAMLFMKPEICAAPTMVPAGWPMTLTTCVALPVPDAAVIVALPEPTPVTVPPVSTVAIATLLLDHVTVAFGTALLFASSTCAVSLKVCPVDSVGAVFVMFTCDAEPTVAVAVNVTAVSDPAVAVSVFAPIVPPNFHEPTVAMPEAFVFAKPPVTEPPPLATAKVTSTFWKRVAQGVSDLHRRCDGHVRSRDGGLRVAAGLGDRGRRTRRGDRDEAHRREAGRGGAGRLNAGGRTQCPRRGRLPIHVGPHAGGAHASAAAGHGERDDRAVDRTARLVLDDDCEWCHNRRPDSRMDRVGRRTGDGRRRDVDSRFGGSARAGECERGDRGQENTIRHSE